MLFFYTHLSWVFSLWRPWHCHLPVLFDFYVSFVSFYNFPLNLGVPRATILSSLLFFICVFSWRNLFTYFIYWLSNLHSQFWSPLICRLEWLSDHWISPPACLAGSWKSTRLKQNSSISPVLKMYLLPCAQSQSTVPIFSSYCGLKSRVTPKQGWHMHNTWSALPHLPSHSHDMFTNYL